MGLMQLPAGLQLLIAGELDTATLKNFRLVCKRLAMTTRTPFARQHAHIRRYSVMYKSWLLPDAVGAADPILESLHDQDFGPAARALKIVSPFDYEIAERPFLKTTYILPELLLFLTAFLELEELIIEAFFDSFDSRRVNALYVPGAILRTLAAAGASLKKVQDTRRCRGRSRSHKEQIPCHQSDLVSNT
jgi:hypothetical protein